MTDLSSIRRAILTKGIAALKAECLAFDAGLRAARLALWLRYDPDQPRVPAGSPDGGRWTSGGGGGGDMSSPATDAVGSSVGDRVGNAATGSADREWTTVSRGVSADGVRTETNIRVDGTTIRSEYAASRAAGFDERNTVATPDGSQRTFESEGLTQSVRNELGEVLSRSEWTPNGAVLEPAAAPIIVGGDLAKATGFAFIAFYAWMSSRNDGQSQAIATARSWGYEGGADIVRVERMSRDEAQLVCEKFGEVQARTNAAADSMASRREELSPTQYGTAVHTHVKHQIDALRNPDFRAEVSLLKSLEAHYGHEGTVRIDVFERAANNTVCIYDIKTGARGMTMPRWEEVAARSYLIFGKPARIILTEIRPHAQ